MAKVRVMVAGMPRILTDIIKSIIAAEDDFEFVGELMGTRGIVNAARDLDADVVIIAAPEDGDEARAAETLISGPRLIIAIAADGRRATIHQLKPSITPLGEVSPAALIAAMREYTQDMGGTP